MTSSQFLKKAMKACAPYALVKLYKYSKQLRALPSKEREIRREYARRVFNEAFLKINQNGEKYFDINGLYFPDLNDDPEYMDLFVSFFPEIFMFYTCMNDNYEKKLSKVVDLIMPDGPYCYSDCETGMDVIINENDIVIDAGAWIGDFSAYAAKKGATVYAFEPAPKTFKYLDKTALMNNPEKIIPVQTGLSDKVEHIDFTIFLENSASNRIGISDKGQNIEILTTTVDDFVKECALPRIDFIKSDVEGYERQILEGAKETLRKFAPKLSFCTYHNGGIDKEKLPRLIKEINPDYQIAHMRKKIFAQVMK